LSPLAIELPEINKKEHRGLSRARRFRPARPCDGSERRLHFRL